MKIISWNVNWIRAVAKKWFKEFVSEYNPDILCIQETKAFEEQFLKEVGELDWYNYVWHSWERAGYAGTAIFFKEDNPLNLESSSTKLEPEISHILPASTNKAPFILLKTSNLYSTLVKNLKLPILYSKPVFLLPGPNS